jgi:hypothetical protein
LIFIFISLMSQVSNQEVKLRLGVVAHTSNPSTSEAEAVGSQIQGLSLQSGSSSRAPASQT